MVILKKIKGTTLMETLVATILIVVIFVLASMILNNLFSSSIKNNKTSIENHLEELQYLKSHNILELPYNEVFKSWDINIDTYKDNDKLITQFEAINKKTNKTIRHIHNDTD